MALYAGIAAAAIVTVLCVILAYVGQDVTGSHDRARHSGWEG